MSSDSPPPGLVEDAAAELRSIARAVPALGEIEWRSPAAEAYRAVLRGIGEDAAELAGELALLARGQP